MVQSDDTCKCDGCYPEIVSYSVRDRFLWMWRFGWLPDPRCTRGVSLAQQRLTWLMLQVMLKRHRWETMPDDPQPEFWPVRSQAPYRGRDLIGQLKSTYRIEDVALRLTPMRGLGNHLQGKCPLHGEQRGMAFNIWLDSQRWHCFGACNRGGDVIDLIRECIDRGIEWRSKTKS